jgi:hypothetical protein
LYRLNIDRYQVSVRVHIVKNLFQSFFGEPFDRQGLTGGNLAGYHELALLHRIATLKHEYLIVCRNRLDSQKPMIFQDLAKGMKFVFFFLRREFSPLFD